MGERLGKKHKKFRRGNKKFIVWGPLDPQSSLRIKGIPKCATQGAFPLARSKKENFTLAESDVYYVTFGQWNIFFFSFSLTFSILW